MEYSCERCGYETNHKKHMVQHLQRVFPCQPLLSSIAQNSLLEDILNENIISTGNACNFCGKEFASRQGKSRHHKICKHKKSKDTTELLETLQKAFQDLTLKLNNKESTPQETPVKNQEVTSQSHNTTNSHNINTNSNNINVKIEIRDFGNENMSALPNDSIGENIMFLKFKEILEMLHFDDDFPENRNFKLISLKKELMQFYKDKKWEAVSLQRGIDDIIMHVCRIYMNYYNNNKDNVVEDVGEDDAIKLFEDLEEIYKLDKKHVKDIRRDIKALLYNYKDT